MTPLKNDRFIRALLRQPNDRTPIWMMRQAGRYLPEYHATREKAGGFMDLCKNAELACEVTLQPLRRYDLDAAILFSDILTIPDAMGLGLSFTPGEGPVFQRTVQNEADINQLYNIDPNQELQYVMNAVSTIRKTLDNEVPLIGFAGSPWTLATYMVEGASSKKGFPKAQKMCDTRPDLMHMLLDKLVIAVTNYLNAQVEAGAQTLMIFDTWGGLLTPEAYIEFSQNKMTDIVRNLHREKDQQKIPVILFTKGGARNLNGFIDSGADGIGLDWTVKMSDVKALVGNKLALQGNLNPNVLLSTPEVIETEVAKVLASYGNVKVNQGHVFNLGHGITPDTPPENVAALVEAVQRQSTQYHTK